MEIWNAVAKRYYCPDGGAVHQTIKRSRFRKAVWTVYNQTVLDLLLAGF